VLLVERSSHTLGSGWDIFTLFFTPATKYIFIFQQNTECDLGSVLRYHERLAEYQGTWKARESLNWTRHKQRTRESCLGLKDDENSNIMKTPDETVNSPHVETSAQMLALTTTVLKQAYRLAK